MKVTYDSSLFMFDASAQVYIVGFVTHPKRVRASFLTLHLESSMSHPLILTIDP